MLLHNILLLFLLRRTTAIRWIALSHVAEVWREAEQCPTGSLQRRKFGLVGYQAKLCKRNPDLMPVLMQSARQTRFVCERAFADRRWNCSSLRQAPKLAADLTKGTREQAFVYSLSAAAVAHGVAKACSQGRIPWCPCGTLPQSHEDGFKWKGCSDNIEYGVLVSKEWADAPWKRYLRRTRSKRKQRKKSLLGPGRQFLADGIGNKISLKAFMEEEDVLTPKLKMNQHNNDVGRAMVSAQRERKCKCHGVSSSCTVKTCWESLPPLLGLGIQLKEKYVHATEVKSRRRGQFQPAAEEETRVSEFESVGLTGRVAENDLVYIKKSPDYCSADPRVGSLGTKGRECNSTANSHANCDSMCCGRGYDTRIEQRVQNCHCKYAFPHQRQGTKGRECNSTANSHANCDSMCCGRGYDTRIEQRVQNCHCKYAFPHQRQGTKGRECNSTANSHANCDSMCCGRGYDTRIEQRVQNCHCKYVHCCYVKCKKCTTTLHRNFCN